MNGQDNQLASGESSRAKAMKIYTDEVKGRHTTHWDMDYLSADELEAAFNAGRPDDDRACQKIKLTRRDLGT